MPLTDPVRLTDQKIARRWKFWIREVNWKLRFYPSGDRPALVKLAKDQYHEVMVRLLRGGLEMRVIAANNFDDPRLKDKDRDLLVKEYWNEQIRRRQRGSGAQDRGAGQAGSRTREAELAGLPLLRD
jgi:hypothetical protein